MNDICTVAKTPHQSLHTSLRAASAVIGCATFLFAGSGRIQAADIILPGHVPVAIQGLQAISPVPWNQQIRLALGLDIRNKEDFAILLEKLYDQTSPSYHRYLTTEQFTEAFGPTMEDHQAVIDFATTNGFEVVGTFPNRLIVDVSASVADVEKAFNLKLFLYQDPTDARIFRAPNLNPSIPSTLPIVDISGLDDYCRAKVNSVIRPLDPTGSAVPNGGSGSGGRWWGGDYRAIYVPGTSLTGSGQRVGIFGIDLMDGNDITNYMDAIGYQRVALTNVFLDGWQENWAYRDDFRGEITTDTELAISMAPGLAEVVVFRGNPTNFFPNHILNAMATHSPMLNQLSSSFSWPGGPTNTTDNIFQEMAAQGQTFFQASGDTWANWYTATSNRIANVDNPLSPTCPQDNPYITVVGGTVLTTTGSPGSWATEVVWSGQNPGYATSGGPSHYYSIPSWQQGIDMSSNLGSTTMRNAPDVALVANNINVVIWGFTNYFFGDSASAPLWAGLAALANQQSALNGDPPVGFVNPALYQAAKGYSYGRLFHDITSGNNSPLGSGQFPAEAGYDLCSGWGSPTGTNTLNLLAPDTSPCPLAQLVGGKAKATPMIALVRITASYRGVFPTPRGKWAPHSASLSPIKIRRQCRCPTSRAASMSELEQALQLRVGLIQRTLLVCRFSNGTTAALLASTSGAVSDPLVVCMRTSWTPVALTTSSRPQVVSLFRTSFST